MFDLERTIDDFVFMSFLLGNDFLPHLPTADLDEGGLGNTFAIYRRIREVYQLAQAIPEIAAAIGTVTSPLCHQPFHFKQLTHTHLIISEAARSTIIISEAAHAPSSSLRQHAQPLHAHHILPVTTIATTPL
jgi:hypothetical protein